MVLVETEWVDDGETPRDANPMSGLLGVFGVLGDSVLEITFSGSGDEGCDGSDEVSGVARSDEIGMALGDEFNNFDNSEEALTSLECDNEDILGDSACNSGFDKVPGLASVGVALLLLSPVVLGDMLSCEIGDASNVDFVVCSKDEFETDAAVVDVAVDAKVAVGDIREDVDS